MATPFLGSIKLFAGSYAPKGWAFCNGQQLAISQNQALFSVLGTKYGGNGTTTFALPDLRGRVPVHYGTGTGISNVTLGQMDGQESVTLLSTNLPQHVHTTIAAPCTTQPATHTDPAGHVFAVPTNGDNAYAAAGGGSAMAGGMTTATAGGSQPHPNMQPYLALNFIIALQGLFPSRP